MDFVKDELHKVKQELKSLLPQHLQDEFTREAYISGGCIYSLYNGKEPKDYDFFVRNEAFATKIREFFMSLVIHDNPFDEQEVEDVKTKNIFIVHYNGTRIVITKNALSVGKKFQIITKFVGEPDAVVREFDFMHNTYWYDRDEVVPLKSWDFLDSSQLIYNEDRARDISGTIIRVHKFCERGMTITNSEVSKMLRKLREVGFTERENEIIDNSGSY